MGASRSPTSARTRPRANPTARARHRERRRTRATTSASGLLRHPLAGGEPGVGCGVRVPVPGGAQPQVVGQRAEHVLGLLGPAGHAEVDLGDGPVAVAAQERGEPVLEDRGQGAGVGTRAARAPSGSTSAAPSAAADAGSARTCCASAHSCRSISVVTLCGSARSTASIVTSSRSVPASRRATARMRNPAAKAGALRGNTSTAVASASVARSTRSAGVAPGGEAGTPAARAPMRVTRRRAAVGEAIACATTSGTRRRTSTGTIRRSARRRAPGTGANAGSANRSRSTTPVRASMTAEDAGRDGPPERVAQHGRDVDERAAADRGEGGRRCHQVGRVRAGEVEQPREAAADDPEGGQSRSA